ncbi:PhzF family phenazine biosynthesis protein [Aggregatimonas sangjinii]|uniref:PhzF family phenazine biosynthesis protein n=1 Tax=Aggregatimonas sangjinii TaxID=2583587 RepID=A0A5B7STP8_9FLAO|nr:PhzF family phenazine biosynthesis protein [Aggregatimonas sangjinii]QCX01572.1 PhzF family phenazine biosynthesis protein [Aggregatimonas sangjinii]
MAENIKYFIVDVFAEEKYAGNQLAVFVDLKRTLSAEQMLAMTREINFAESAFIRSCEDEDTFAVRIFTPVYEVPFAGHPCLGSTYVIARHLMATVKGSLHLRLQKTVIPIRISSPKKLDDSRFTMQQAQPIFGATFSATEIASGLGIPLDSLDAKMQIQEVDTGLPYLLIFLKDLKSMRQLHFNEQKVIEFLLNNQMHKSNSITGLSTSIFLVTPETVDANKDYHTRMFALENGKICEDAATGSANGCLLAYLLKYTGKSQSVIVEQGYGMGRKSILYLDGTIHNNEYIINVGGQVVPISEGTWYVA